MAGATEKVRATGVTADCVPAARMATTTRVPAAMAPAAMAATAMTTVPLGRDPIDAEHQNSRQNAGQ